MRLTLPLRYATIICTLVWTLVPGVSHALDTNEPYAPGATNYEFSLRADQLGASDPAIYADTLLAFGIKPWLGLETQFIMEADARLRTAGVTVASALLFTPLDTTHFDLDVITGVQVSNDGVNEAQLNGMVELNLDTDDDMSFLGAFARVGVEIYNDHARNSANDETVEFLIPVEVGGYWSPLEGHQLLLEYAGFVSAAGPSPTDVFSHSQVAIGYNVLFGADLELVTQVGVNVPRSGVETSASVLIGFIKVWDHVTPVSDAQ